MRILRIIVLTAVCWKLSLQQDASDVGLPDGAALIYRKEYNSNDTCLCQPFCTVTRGSYLRRNAFENVAFNKPAHLSSRYTASSRLTLDACGAVNGRVSNCHLPINFTDVSGANCIHTAEDDREPWWKVDLLYVYTFKHLLFYRREGHHGRDRMANTRVFVDLKLCYQFPDYDHVGELSDLALVYKLKCYRALTGRFVTFAKPKSQYNSSEYHLQICELQIWVCRSNSYGSLRSTDSGQCSLCPEHCTYTCDNWHGCGRVIHNVAIGKNATESEATSSYGVETMTDGLVYVDVYCFKQDADPDGLHKLYWIRVDLETTFKVIHYVIHPYDNATTPTSPRDFYALVGSDSGVVRTFPPPRDVQCQHFTGTLPERTNTTLQCDEPRIGRYFFLVRNGTEGFKLCELEVIGHHRYVLENGARCYNGSETAVCLTGSICQSRACKATFNYPCEEDDHCESGTMCDRARSLCKLAYDAECNVVNGQCASTLTCEAMTQKCKKRLNVNCSDDEECVSALCDRHLTECRTRTGEGCTEDEDCTAGATCHDSACTCNTVFSIPAGNLCNPMSRRIGSSCNADGDCDSGLCQENKCACESGKSIYAASYSCKLSANSPCSDSSACNTFMECQSDVGLCKVKVGHSCYGNTDICLQGLSCGIDTICRISPGEPCNRGEYLCVIEAVCIEGRCKLTLNRNCSRHADHCKAVMVCSEEEGDFKCKLKEGQKCSFRGADNQEDCRSGTHCDVKENVCKVDLGEPCENTTMCQSGTMCATKAGPNGPKKCRLRFGSVGCQDDEHCDGAHVCDSQNRCLLGKDADCEDSPSGPALCLAGSTCKGGTCQCSPEVTDEGSPKCSPEEGRVGGACGVRTNGQPGCQGDLATCTENKCHCPDSFTANPDDLTCSLGAGFSCSINGSLNGSVDPCATGASCTDGTCFLDPGRPCSGTESVFCVLGTECDVDGFCRLGLDQNCLGQDPNCKSGAICDALHRCKTKASGFCRNNYQCAAGSECTDMSCRCLGNISVPTNDGTCDLKAGIVGAECGENGTCDDPNANCSSGPQPVCQCQRGLVPEARRLKCTKKAGEDCDEDSECTTGMVCDQKAKQCKIEVNMLCDGDKKKHCVTGAVCDFDYKCRLDINGACSGDRFAVCARGTYCDKLGKCHYGVGDPCKSANMCVAGSRCVKSVCKCDESISTKYGAVCDPIRGLAGSFCEETTACDSPNTVCVNDICACEHGTPDRMFSCGKKSKTGGSYMEYISIVFGLLLAGLLALCFIVYWRTQHKVEKFDDFLQEAQSEINKIVELKEDVSDILAEEAEQGGGGGAGQGFTEIAQVNDLEESGESSAAMEESGGSDISQMSATAGESEVDLPTVSVDTGGVYLGPAEELGVKSSSSSNIETPGAVSDVPLTTSL